MPSRVARPDLESLLTVIQSETDDPRTGIFGPSSITWSINRESAVFLGAGRAALLQLAHPWVATALADHSSLLGNPVARFHNTFRIVYTMIFGTLTQALAASRHLHTLHTGIHGELPEPVAAWPRGAHYEANEIAALRWVYATLVESAVLAYECVLSLTPAEREHYYQESRTMAALFGIPAAALPPNWSAFTAYCQDMQNSGELGVSPAARRMAHAVLSGAGSWIHPPHWYRALTAEWMPARLRTEFDLPSNPVAAARAQRWLPRIYRTLPPPIRYVGPWHEAQSRLGGHSAGPLTRLNNRFWIGQPTLPFGGHGLI
jgi:uncharacterized protein (DUF2236 family)